LAEREREMPLRKIKKPKLLWVEQAHLDNMETSFQLFEESSWIAPFKLESANRLFWPPPRKNQPSPAEKNTGKTN
jgi:hypothetical protein